MNAAPAGSPGVDYAWARPNPSSLHSWGYRFACRYLSHDSGKNLSATEARALIGAGVDVVLNWESTATSALGGAPQGTSDGQAAQQQAVAVDAPARAAIYFSVDFDAQPNQFATIAGYLDAARKQIGGRKVGVYGGKALIDAMVGTHADLGWQTLAWSYGQISSKAAIYQDRVNITLPDGSPADHNRILKAEYGGWLAPVQSSGDLSMADAQQILDALTNMGKILEDGNQASPGHVGLRDVKAELDQMRADIAAIRAKVGA